METIQRAHLSLNEIRTPLRGLQQTLPNGAAQLALYHAFCKSVGGLRLLAFANKRGTNSPAFANCATLQGRV